MSKLIGTVGGTDPEVPNAIVSTSSAGVEFQCDPEFTLRPEQALEFASIITQAARERIVRAAELAGEIRDPAKLAELAEDTVTAENGQKLVKKRRIVRR